MAYYPPLQGLLLFGGYDPSVKADGDTWLYANGSWTLVSAGGTTSDPPARWGAAMVWDPVDQYLMLFGGRTPTQFYNDTWVYNSSGWTNLTGTVAPAPRNFVNSFWDPNLKKVVILDGGCNLCGGTGWVTYNDTWTFVGGVWKNASTSLAPLPSHRRLAVGAWDPVDNESMVYGGTTGQVCGAYNSTYVLHTNWSAVKASTNPGNYSAGVGTWDAIDGYFLDFGGIIPTPNNSANSYCNPPSITWSFVGGKWTNLTSKVSSGAPSGRCCAEMAYDAAARLAVMFGGNDYVGTWGNYMNETWTYPVAPLNATILSSAVATFVNGTATFSANVSGGMLNFSYNWSFGDGSANGTTASVTHAYATAGTYDVRLEVVDAQGRSVNRSIAFRVVQALTSSISAKPQLGEAPLTVKFNTTLNGGLAPFTYDWSFGDGGVGSYRNLTYTYRTAGTFNATLVLTDSFNESLRMAVAVSVLGPVGVVLGASSSVGVAPFQVNFTATGTGGQSPYNYSWSFGDGSPTRTGVMVNHTYLATGGFRANLTVTDSLGYSALRSQLITVYAPEHVVVNSSTLAGLVPLTVLLTANLTGGVPPVTVSWNFGDGTPLASGYASVHTYQLAGLYRANATATDAQGHTATAGLRIDAVGPLSESIQATPTSGATPLTVSFTVQRSGGLAPFSGVWTFGDGMRANGLNLTHTYTAAGPFTATLTIGDSLGEVGAQSVKISTYQPLAVGLVAEPATLTLGASTTLVGSAHGGTGTIVYGWSGLPPGCLSKDAVTLSCTPTATGIFAISFNATDGAGELAHSNATLTVQQAPSSGGPPCSVLGTCSNGSAKPSGGSGGLSTLELGGIIGAVAAAALVTGILLARRRPPSPPADEAPPADPPTELPDQPPDDSGALEP